MRLSFGTIVEFEDAIEQLREHEKTFQGKCNLACLWLAEDRVHETGC